MLTQKISSIIVLSSSTRAFLIACDDLNISVCNVADTEGIGEIDEPIEVVGQEFDGIFLNVNGFYAISRGNFKQIPSNLFDKMPNLENFYATDVGIEVLPTNSFKSCSKLKKIGLQKNKIQELGDEFGSGCSLTYNLDLSCNKIANLKSTIFKGFQSITILNLDFNFIEEISEGLFNEMPNLSLLQLDMNNIAFVHPKAFTNHLNLNTLILANNRIKVVKAEWFANKNYFERINLKNNEIEAISPQIFNVLLDAKINITENLFEINFEKNSCVDADMRKISKNTALHFDNRLYKCFNAYENNYFYKKFP